MDSHLDADAMRRREQFMSALREKADTIRSQGRSQITGGHDGEHPLAQYDAHGVHVTKRPDDEQGILRISIGGGDHLPVELNYCVFRGDKKACVALLKKALAALESAN